MARAIHTRYSRPNYAEIHRAVIAGLGLPKDQANVSYEWGSGFQVGVNMAKIFGIPEAIHSIRTVERITDKTDGAIAVNISRQVSPEELLTLENDLVLHLNARSNNGAKFRPAKTLTPFEFEDEKSAKIYTLHQLIVMVPLNADSVIDFINAVIDFENDLHSFEETDEQTDEPSADGAAAAAPAQELTTKPLTKLQLAKRELDQLAEEEATLNAALAAAERAEKEAKEAARLEAEQAVELEKTRAEIAARKQAMAEKQAKLAALKSATQSDTWHTPKNAVKLNEATPTPTPEGALPKNSFAVLAVEPEQGASWA